MHALGTCVCYFVISLFSLSAGRGGGVGGGGAVYFVVVVVEGISGSV